MSAPSARVSTSEHNTLQRIAVEEAGPAVVSQTTYMRYGLYDAEEEAEYGESYPSRHEAAAELASLYKRYDRDRVGEMEVRVRHQGRGVLIVTSAPEDYDRKR
jgi:hypothetical protein